VAEVRRWLARGGDVDRADDFDMTPLAWAVVRRRPEVAIALQDAGANPLAGSEAGRDFGPTPLKLALLLRDEALVQRFLTPTILRQLTPWPRPLIEAAVQAGHARLLARMLREPHERVLAQDLLPLSARQGTEATTQVLRTYAEAKCWRAPTPADARLQLVAVYAPIGGSATVLVEADRHPVILALSHYEAVDWRIEALPGAKIAGVIALGYHEGTVNGVGDDVPVLINSIDGYCEDDPPGPWAFRPGKELQQLINKLEKMTGRETGAYQTSYDQRSFVVARSDPGPAPLAFDAPTPVDGLRNSRIDDAALIAAVKARSPAADAASALRENKLGLFFRWIRERGGGASEVPIGVVCQASVQAGSLPRSLELTSLGAPPSSTSWRADIRGEAAEAVLDAYARVYNRALVSSRDYPFRDVCASGEARRTQPWPLVDPTRWSIPMQRPARPRTLGDAARIGDAAAVRHQLAARATLDVEDSFRMTPLAWAVTRGHDRIALALLDRGARPMGVNFNGDTFNRPITLAIVHHRNALFDRMAAADWPERRPWRYWLMDAALKADNGHALKRMLAEPHDHLSKETLRQVAQDARDNQWLKAAKALDDAFRREPSPAPPDPARRAPLS
jgi:hypothetical protein